MQLEVTSLQGILIDMYLRGKSFNFYHFSCFFSVYSVAVDTLFLCLLEDLERNDGSLSKPYFMSKKLRKLVVKSSNSSGHGHVFTVSEAFT